jgi:cytochrome P450
LGPHSCFQLVHPDHIHEVLVRQAKKFRKPARLKQVFGRFEGNGLVVSDGEFWARQRRLVQPAFAPAQSAGYAADIVRLAADLIDRWGAPTEIDFAAQMRRLTLAVVAKTLFSTSIEDDVVRLGEAVDAIQEWSMRELNRVVALPRWLPLFGQPRARRGLAFIDVLVRRIVRARQASDGGPDDLLAHLLEAVDSEGDCQGMSDRQLRDELVTLLLAGHDTQAAALTWAGWLLACHPDIQDRAAQEVRSALGERLPQVADLPRLAYVEQVFKETLRLCPPIYFFSREAAEPVEVGGYTLPPSSQVFLSPYLTQHDERWFPDPERFDPLRFSPENERRMRACAWFPFGAGPRACVGRGFAMLEGTLILAVALQRCRLRPAAGQGEPRRLWQLSLHPQGGLCLAVQ